MAAAMWMQDSSIERQPKENSKSIWRRAYYNDFIMGTIAFQITSLTIVYSTIYSDADQRKHQSSASLAFAREIHRGPVNSPHKWPLTRKMFPVEDVIMATREVYLFIYSKLHSLKIMQRCYYGNNRSYLLMQIIIWNRWRIQVALQVPCLRHYISTSAHNDMKNVNS